MNVSRRLVPLALILTTIGCGLTVTNENPPYQQLDAKEKRVVEIILKELTALNTQIKARTRYTVDPLLDRENINVSFEGLIFVGNFGDGEIHVSTWENLTDTQRTLVQTWFKAKSPDDAAKTYETFFYHFLAVSQGVKQFIYNALSPQWIFEHRSLFNFERDSIRTALSHYDAIGRRAEMWTFLTNTCLPVISQYGTFYMSHFDKVYLQDHLTELADPRAPTGYLYFTCRWILLGKDEAEDLTRELNWLLGLKN